MAKNETKTFSKREARPKTQAQLAQAAKNRQLAEERLKKLQERQQLVKELRAAGAKGRTDAEVLANWEEMQKAQPSVEQLAADYVNLVIKYSGIAGRTVESWLGKRLYSGGPLAVQNLIREYVDRPENKWIKDAIEISKVHPLKRAA
jgi:tRNA A37 methylthiotransferase MiaB